MKRQILRAAFLIILSAAIFFCSSCKKGDGETEIVIPSGTGTTKEPTAPATVGTKGELVLPIPENSVRDNPYSVTTEEMLTMYSTLFEPLIDIDDTGKLVPALAQSWTRDEQNSRAWIINLRTNVLWHSGEIFTAADVIYSFNTLKSYLGTKDASQYYKSCTDQIESIEQTDDMIVRVKFYSSGYNALYSLNFPIICKETAQTAPQNGTGAYKLTSSTSKGVTLEVNNSWWKESAHIKILRFEERLNNETALASFSAGQLNFVPTSNLSAGKYRKEGVTNVIDVMTQDAELLLFNYSNSLMYDMNIKRAIVCGIDRSKIITNVYMNRAQTSDVPITPDSWLYSTQYNKIEFNIDKANSLLENAGYRDSDGDGIREKDGNPAYKLSFTLLVSKSTDNTARKNAADQIAAQLAECGIEIIVDARDYCLGDSESDYIKALSEGEFDIALTGVNLSQNGDLTEFFKNGGALNFGKVWDEKLYELSTAINTAEDETKMRECAYEFQSAFVDKLPFVVLYFRLNSIVYSNDLKGVGQMREPDIMNSLENWYFE